MTGTFQIKKQLDGGVQELLELSTKDVLAVNDPVSFDTDGTLIPYATTLIAVGVNSSEMASPEFYDAADITNIGTTPVKVLISPIKHNSNVEVIPSVAITSEATIIAEIGQTAAFNSSLELIVGTPGVDAQIVDYMVYTAKDGSVTINPIVKLLITQY